MEDRVAELESRLTAVEQRLAALDGGPPSMPASGQVSASSYVLGEGALSSAATHIGKVLLIFGGAYFLRAITELGVVATGFGLTLGASYALLWLLMSYRSAGTRKHRATAVFYGGASVLLALPLLVEATTRFGLLSGQQGVIALAIFSALALLAAVARNLRSLGWMSMAGAVAAAFVLLMTSRSAVPVAAFLAVLGLSSLWVVYLRQWVGPQWLGALAADAGVLTLVLLSASDRWPVGPRAPFLLAVALLLSYGGSFAFRSHLQSRSVGMFETVQGLLAVGLVFWAAAVAAQAGGMELAQSGFLSLVLGSCAYALAFTPETRSQSGRNFYFYSTLGLALVVAGSALLLTPGRAAAVWSLMALALAWCSGRFGRVSLSLQCTFLLLAAGVGSGVLATGFQALGGEAIEVWPLLKISHLIVAGATVGCLFLPVAQSSARWGALAGLPQLTVLALSVAEVGGLMVLYAAPLLAGVPGAEAELGILAALRTAVLSAASVTLALSSRHRRWPEARWLVYPVLLLVGIKLFVEDFPHGQPATLFVALALVGSALLAVAKLLSRGSASASQAG